MIVKLDEQAVKTLREVLHELRVFSDEHDGKYAIDVVTQRRFAAVVATADHPDGCKCGNNGGGDCDWCKVYYGWD